MFGRNNNDIQQLSSGGFVGLGVGVGVGGTGLFKYL